GLYGLDLAERFALGDLVACFGQVNEGKVIQLVHREVGDADRDGAVRFKAAPFVGFEVAGVVGSSHRSFLLFTTEDTETTENYFEPRIITNHTEQPEVAR